MGGLGAQTCRESSQLPALLVAQSRSLNCHVGGGVGATLGLQVPPEIVGASSLAEPWLPTHPDMPVHTRVDTIAHAFELHAISS